MVRDDDFLEGRERARLYREEESRGNTWKDRVIYCYGRLQHGVLVVCGCQGEKGDSQRRGERGFLRFGRTLFPSLAASPLPCPLSVEHFSIYKYRYQDSLSLSFSFPVLQHSHSGEPRNHYAWSSCSRALYLLYHILCQGPSVAYVCNGPPTPGIPRWVSNTYLHGRGTTVSGPDPVHTPRPSPAPPPPTPPPPSPGPH